MITADRRMLLVHAHPDDETIGNGATMAKYVAEGAHVTLVTCTLGEEGEILVPDLEHLAADKDDGLGEHRIGELADAMKALGVTDHRFLGGAGRWRDSGMMGTAHQRQARTASGRPTSKRPSASWSRVIREVRPQVVITYNENGGYGHPDHIQAHRVAVAAFEAAADPGRYPDAGEPWQPSKLYYIAFPVSFLRMGYDALKEMGEEAPFGVTARGAHRSVTRTRRSRPRSTRATTSTRRWTRCGPTRPRSRPTGRSSRCPTTSATGRSGWSSTGWSGERCRTAGRARERAKTTCSRGSDRPVRNVAPIG